MKPSNRSRWLSVSLWLSLWVACGVLAAGCSAEDLRGYSDQHPKAGPTTRAVEAVEKQADKVATVVLQIAPAVQPAAVAATAATGFPFTSVVEGLIVVAGMYLGHRQGSKSALAVPPGASLTPPPSP